jgi:Holliday junction resolvasome RuvABC endonuclease subunit
MITLGIDPGTAIMGYGLVESGVAVPAARNARASGGDTLRLVEYGALYTPANTPLSERLPQLY